MMNETIMIGAKSENADEDGQKMKMESNEVKDEPASKGQETRAL